MSDDNPRHVIEKLRDYEARIQRLLDFLKDDIALSPDKKANAQGQMKELKEALKADYRRGSTVGGQAAMNPTERSSLHPAIHGAFTDISVQWNSTPSRKWHSELCEALLDIQHYRRQLEE